MLPKREVTPDFSAVKDEADPGFNLFGQLPDVQFFVSLDAGHAGLRAQ